MGQIASCQYIGSSFRVPRALHLGGRKMTVAGSVAPLPTKLPKLKSKCHCVRLPVHTCAVCANKGTCVPTDTWDDADVDKSQTLASSIFYFGEFGALAHSQAERMRDTERGKEIHPPAVTVLLKTTSSHCVYLSHLSEPRTALCSKSHFSRADYSVCSINSSLHLSPELPL